MIDHSKRTCAAATLTLDPHDRSRRMARISTYAASLIWAVLVLVQVNAVSVTPYVRLITVENEKAWGVVIGIMSATMLYRLWRGRHSWVGLLLHTGLLVFWLYTLLSLYMNSLVFPIGGATVPVIVGLALYGITDHAATKQ